jgi:hypothetical protein
VIGMKTMTRAARERLSGGTPSKPRASFTAAAVGSAVAVFVYRTLRS